jgi:hypothetical protein
VLDGSFGWDLRDLLRQGEEGGRLPQDEKVRHLQKVDIFADCTKKQLKAVAGDLRALLEVPAGTMLTRVGEPVRGVLLHPRRGGDGGRHAPQALKMGPASSSAR